MAIVVMIKHQKRTEKHNSIAIAKSVTNIYSILKSNADSFFLSHHRYWLRTSITMTLVMSITWLVGVLVLRKLVTTVDYISTAQAAAILSVLVPLSEQVSCHNS